MSLMGRIERRVDKNVRLKAAEMAGRELAAECVHLRMLVLLMWDALKTQECILHEDKIRELMAACEIEMER